MSKDEQALSVESAAPSQTTSTVTTTASGRQQDNQTTATTTASNSTPEHGDDMDTLLPDFKALSFKTQEETLNATSDEVQSKLNEVRKTLDYFFFLSEFNKVLPFQFERAIKKTIGHLTKFSIERRRSVS